MQTSRRRGDAGAYLDSRSSKSSSAGVLPNTTKSGDIIEEDLNAVNVDLGPMDVGTEESEPFIKGQDVPPPPKPEKTAQQKMMAVAFYWVCSLCLVFINKSVMVGDVINLDAPLFMSWTQFLITVICCAILGKLGRYFSPFSFFPQFEYKLHIAKKVMPLTVVFLGMIVFNNLCLKYVEVSFYQVARSMTIVCNIVLTYLLLKKSTNRNSIICCVVIIIGYLMGCDGEVRFDWTGVTFGLLSSIFVALNSIYVKKILPVVDDNSEKLMIYNNLNAVLLLPIFIVLFTVESFHIFQCIFSVDVVSMYGEQDEIIEITVSQYAFQQPAFWGITVIAGIFGFLINFASYIQIKFTSPLTHNVSGTAKAAAQTVIALYVFKNPTTATGLIGCGVVIVGSFAYSRVK